MRQVGVRELRQQLREVLDAVEQGEAVEITRGGRRLAVITPLAQPVPAEVARLLGTGEATWGGKFLTELPTPQPLLGEGPTLSEMVLQDREERHRAVLGE